MQETYGPPAVFGKLLDDSYQNYIGIYISTVKHSYYMNYLSTV